VIALGASTDSDRRALLAAYREHGDLGARDQLVEDLMPFVRSVARRYAGRGEQLDDLVQVASLGLVKAIERFDLDRDVELLAYVFPTVVGELKRHFRDRVWSVTVPRRLKELHYLLSRKLDEMTATLGRSPTIPELAEAAGVDEEEVVEALEVGRAYTTRSLYGGIDDPEGSDLEPIDSLSGEEEGYEATENRAVLASGFRALDERERTVLHLRFFEGLTQTQIAVEIGVSQMHVSRLIRKALAKLESEIEEEP
jgi:RNA polymerase sigma-B factor